MAALARGRGWTYQLQGSWEGADDYARLDLPAYGLHAALRVSAPWEDQNLNDSSTYTHTLTHEVRFQTSDGWDVDLQDVAERIFSEVMRDVDLLVGVTSIANDPAWLEVGDPGTTATGTAKRSGNSPSTQPAAATFSNNFSLAFQSQMRPRSTASFCESLDNCVTYKIHLGSTNVLMEPNDEYLCIVPRPGPKAPPKVFLPFEGDAALEVIISKALMLARDDQITDPTILHQILAPT